MHLEVLVEERSAEEALKALLLKLGVVDFQIHPFQGKQDLLGKLPARLAGYAAWLPRDWRIAVLLDEDGEDCDALKAQLQEIASTAGLTPRSAAAANDFIVLNRIAVEELEAWFFGDIPAMRSAYPRLPATLHERARFRDPDAIKGGTWEALERLLKTAGYHQAGLPKIEAARRISAHMDPWSNNSRSFQVFRDGLLLLRQT